MVCFKKCRKNEIDHFGIISEIITKRLSTENILYISNQLENVKSVLFDENQRSVIDYPKRRLSQQAIDCLLERTIIKLKI
jgi:hypothetical protein